MLPPSRPPQNRALTASWNAIDIGRYFAYKPATAQVGNPPKERQTMAAKAKKAKRNRKLTASKKLEATKTLTVTPLADKW